MHYLVCLIATLSFAFVYGDDKVLFVVSSAVRGPNAYFCNNISDYGLRAGVAAELMDAPVDGKDRKDYVSQTMSIVPYYDTWPYDLQFNPVTGTGPFVKNIGDRNLMLTGMCMWRSPNKSDEDCYASFANCGDIIAYYPPPPNSPPDSVQSTMKWHNIADNACLFTYPDSSIPAQITSSAPAGQVYASFQSQAANFYYAKGITIVQITDEWGNKYAMHSMDADTTVAPQDIDLAPIRLPAGWRVNKVILEEDLFIYPTRWNVDDKPSNFAFKVMIRDNVAHGYHQFAWGADAKYMSVVTRNPYCVTRMEEIGLLTEQEPKP